MRRRCYDTAARCYDTAASRVILGIGRLVITADQAHTPGLCLQQDSTTNRHEMGLCYVAVMCGAARCVGNRLKRCQFCNPICMRLLWAITVRVGARGRTDVVQRQLSGGSLTASRCTATGCRRPPPSAPHHRGTRLARWDAGLTSARLELLEEAAQGRHL